MEGQQKLSGLKLLLGASGIALAAFLVSLDGFIVNVAIPTISSELGVREDAGTWIITLFTMASTLFVPLSGFLAARIGSLRLFISSILLFILFSLLSGATHDFQSILIFRMLQGATAGILTPLSLALIISTFPEDKRSIAVGFWSFFVMVGPAMGPMIGGWLSDYYWAWMFYINIPLGLISAAMVYYVLGDLKEKKWKIPIDWVGVISLFAAIWSLQVALNRGNIDDWFRSPFIVTLFIISALSWIFFFIWERFQENPFIDLSFFKRSNFVISILCMGCAMGMLFSSFILDSLWVQNQLGYTPAWAGYTLTPVGLFPLLLYPIMGKFVSYLDLRLWIISSFLLYSGTFFWLSHLNLEVSFWQIALPRLIQGIGFAMFTVPVSLLAIEGIPEEKRTFVISLFSFVRMLLVSLIVPLSINLWYHREAFYQTRITERAFLGNPSYENLIAPLEQLVQAEPKITALANQAVTYQSWTLGLTDIYYLFAWMFLLIACAPFLLKLPKKAKGIEPLHIGEH